MEIETDKTTVGVPTPVSGTIEEIYVKDGDTVKAGQELFKIKEGAVSAKPAAEAKPAAAATPPTPPPQAAAAKPAAAAPPARPAAPPAAAPPPPPRPQAPAAQIPVAAIRHAQAVEASVKVPPADYSREISGTRTEQRVKMNRMRLKIASRLKEAQNTNAMLTTFNEIDMRYVRQRKKLKKGIFDGQHKPYITFNESEIVRDKDFAPRLFLVHCNRVVIWER